MGQLTVLDRHRTDRSEIRLGRSPPHGQDARLRFVAAAVAVEDLLQQAVDAARAGVPGRRQVDRRQLHLDVLAPATIQIEHGGDRRTADQRQHVDTKIVEHERGTAHRRDVETFPGG